MHCPPRRLLFPIVFAVSHASQALWTQLQKKNLSLLKILDPDMSGPEKDVELPQ